MPRANHLQTIAMMQSGTRIGTIGGVGHTRQPKRKPGLLDSLTDRRQPRRSLLKLKRTAKHRCIIEVSRIDFATGEHRRPTSKSHRLDPLDH